MDRDTYNLYYSKRYDFTHPKYGLVYPISKIDEEGKVSIILENNEIVKGKGYLGFNKENLENDCFTLVFKFIIYYFLKCIMLYCSKLYCIKLPLCLNP